MSANTKIFADLVEKAHAAGVAAAAATKPTPIVVSEHADPLNDASPVTREWYVPSGVCGFAGVRLRPANSAFAHYLKKLGWRKAYHGGIESSVSFFNQSLELKTAYATAYAEVLRNAGFNAYAWDRLD
jgi:hypothetical protein